MSGRPVLVIATRNRGKARELADLLEGLSIELRDLQDFSGAPEVAEEGETYLENARAKAVAIARFTGLPALADDSGLEVDALGGAPGVRSARFAGAQGADVRNLEMLLQRMQGLPPSRRTARFRCVIVVARPELHLLIGEGVCEGTITAEPRGSGGFGYDPVFYHPPSRATLAEMEPSAKNRISHRAAACRPLRSVLVPFLREPAANTNPA